MSCLRRVTSALIILLFPMVWAVSAAAESTAQAGEIQVKMTYNKNPLPGGSLTLYQLAGISENELVLTQQFYGSGVDASELRKTDTAGMLAQYAADHNIPGISIEIGATGIVRFTELSPGAYLVVQWETADGFMPICPFIISIPMVVEGEYIYNISAGPKCEKETKPGEIPSQSSDPKLPQTGQLNWIVWVLAASGLVLCWIGGRLYFVRRKKDSA